MGKEGNPHVPREMKRRDFLRRATLAGGAVVTGVNVHNWGKKELEVSRNGLETEHAIFYPLYEQHFVGINEKQIPGQLDFYFPENIANKANVPLKKMLTKSSGWKSEPIVSPQILDRLVQQKTTLMFNDVAMEHAAVAVAMPGAEVLSGMIARELLFKQVTDRLPRRDIFKKAANGYLAWGIVGMSGILNNAVAASDSMTARRMVARATSFGPNLHPEDYLVGLRNALWTNKMLTVAEEFHEQTGRKASIAYNVGSGHANVEDFIRLGCDFSREYILAHPDPLLRYLMNVNGGATAFGGSRVMQLGSAVDAKDPAYIDKLTVKSDRYVIDPKLQRALARL